ncbi:Hit1p CYBJADRAFT_63487 [Cyberlindnera jadinii NRRL Y-1542]|uniref:HIT-type domain-containing protein n=1 Tax=Cyberlindnera jadinii (strain ATCC 18201 / CBS 1600 / BCRC 20928 / JCM 3617 / NBRC 0987 / NRRL Y-1542) TaxID=983966 RepID=A0A1E4S5W9_CYBJN|nr:hypothetical protein CYBJADRAFT_63487 [Cyberlindnera jadinii NRRL Y-1542]ODV74853.1 hypothetical protein CYBJADRAFT_63487 [Cyberlindnera jadinii NRRL Y-1542]
MVKGTCGICIDNDAKYKCPKCDVVYCSLKCFKDPKHVHSNDNETGTLSATVADATQPIEPVVGTTEYQSVFQDERIRYLLKFEALRIHLYSIYKILKDEKLTREKKLDQANEKLNSLRIAGAQENELVEEFCELVVQLIQKK